MSISLHISAAYIAASKDYLASTGINNRIALFLYYLVSSLQISDCCKPSLRNLLCLVYEPEPWILGKCCARCSLGLFTQLLRMPLPQLIDIRPLGMMPQLIAIRPLGMLLPQLIAIRPFNVENQWSIRLNVIAFCMQRIIMNSSEGQ